MLRGVAKALTRVFGCAGAAEGGTFTGARAAAARLRESKTLPRPGAALGAGAAAEAAAGAGGVSATGLERVEGPVPGGG